MVIFTIGGSSSGKSEFAENIACEIANGRLIYIAAMIPRGEEGMSRVKKHRQMRSDKGFLTEERYTGLKNISLLPSDTVLLECMSNLLANEMYEENGSGSKAVQEIITGIDKLIESAQNTVIVSNDIFIDGIAYDKSTQGYISNLGLINRYISSRADEVYEIVCGIPIKIKGE